MRSVKRSATTGAQAQAAVVTAPASPELQLDVVPIPLLMDIDLDKPPEPPVVPSIPQELVDHILDHLFDDIPALLSCALVCRAWLPTCRLHLFSNVSLSVPRPGDFLTALEEDLEMMEEQEFAEGGPVGDPNFQVPVVHPKCRRLESLLGRNPEIAPYIHTLSISSGSPNFSGSTSSLIYDPADPSISEPTPPWIFTEPSLPPLLRRLTSLQNFTFTNQQAILRWDFLPTLLRKAVYGLLRSESLTCLTLKYWSFRDLDEFAGVLGVCGNLKALSLWSVNLGEVEDASAISTSPSQAVQIVGVAGTGTGMGAGADDGADEEGLNEESEVMGGEDGMPEMDMDQTEEDMMSASMMTTTTRPCTLEFLSLNYVDCMHLGEWLLNPRKSNVDVRGLRDLRVMHSRHMLCDQLLEACGKKLEVFLLKPGPLGRK
jgi:hypothetical protein